MADDYGDKIKNFYPMIDFMAKEHTDPVDKFVARFLNLRWDGFVVSEMVVDGSPAQALALHTALLADAVLAQVQKLRHYGILENSIDQLKATNSFLLDDTFAFNQAPNVIENLDFYMAIAEFCEKQLQSEAVRLSIKPRDPRVDVGFSIDWSGWPGVRSHHPHLCK